MRSLNRSLPKTKQPSPAPQPEITQTFRAAALTVTNLYKSAIAEIDKAHGEGYQDALRDLVAFLDREKLGGADGEGWKIRQWAAERFDGTIPLQHSSDSDEEVVEEKEAKRARSSSPAMERISSPEDNRTSEPPHAESIHRSDSAPPPAHTEPTTTDMSMDLPQTVFQFSSPQTWPSNNNTNDSAGPDMSGRRAFATPRRTSRPGRNLQRTAVSNLFSLGNGAGQKRKLMQEYFNIDGINNDRRDGTGGGSKRGRMS